MRTGRRPRSDLQVAQDLVRRPDRRRRPRIGRPGTGSPSRGPGPQTSELQIRLPGAHHVLPEPLAPTLNLDGLDLAALLCSRVCHDVISPVGAIVNGLEVLEDDQDESMRTFALELIGKSARQASARLKFARIAFGAAGSAGASIDLADAEGVAKGMFVRRQDQADLERPAGPVPQEQGQAPPEPRDDRDLGDPAGRRDRRRRLRRRRGAHLRVQGQGLACPHSPPRGGADGRPAPRAAPSMPTPSCRSTPASWRGPPPWMFDSPSRMMK